jgi:hypothetical protein
MFLCSQYHTALFGILYNFGATIFAPDLGARCGMDGIWMWRTW